MSTNKAGVKNSALQESKNPKASQTQTQTDKPNTDAADSGNKSSGLMIAIQIGLGLLIIVVLYILTLVVLNIDSLVVDGDSKVKPRQTTKIIDGYASASYLTNKIYNTVTPHATNFRKIGKSINTNGGAQFTYQSWVRVQDANDELFKDLVFLIKGDKRLFKIGYYQENNEGAYVLSKSESAHAISAPLIKFTNSYKNLRVTMNTVNHPLVNIDINMNAAPGAGRQNLLSLMAMNSWFLFTFVFIDSFSIPRAAEDGIKFIFYVNDVPYIEHTGASMPVLKNNALRQNEGDLNLFPNNPNAGEFLRIGNLSYHNYALSPKEVQNSYESGPPTHSAVHTDARNNQPVMLSAYNKIDMYNA